MAGFPILIAWDHDHLVIDTATQSPVAAVETILRAVGEEPRLR
jgi:hypothetical protein